MTNRFLTKQRSLNSGNRFVARHRGGTITRSRMQTENADLENDTNEVWEGPATFAQSLTVSAHCPLNRASDASSAHFSLSEFHSRDGEEVPESLRGNVQEVMNNLEILRAELGEPITVGSGYRSPAHNSSVGGKPRSQHLCGRAADITVPNYTPRQVHAKIEELITAGRMTQGGLGLYRNFVHYDVRGTRARWDQSNGETAPAVRRPASSAAPTSGAASAPAREMTHTISQRGIDLIKEFEGFRGELYDDPAGHCTIGYGNLVHRGRCDGSESAEFRGGITEARALELLREKLNTFELAVNDAVTVRMNSNQFSALVSLCYNIGTGAFRGSTLLRKLNLGNYVEVPAEMRRWNKAGGNVLPGLVRRREREAALFAEQPSTSQSLSGGQTARSTFEFESPSPFSSRSMGMYASQMTPVLIAGITVAEAIQIGLGGAAMVQAGVSGTQGSFSLTYDTAQRLLTSEARAQMPGSHATKQPYSRRLLYLPQVRAGTAYAEIIIEWEGNPFGEISTPVIRRDLSTSSDFERSSANIAIRKIESIPNTSIDPRAWPIVYSYEGTYDPLGTGHWEFTGEFEINAFGGLKFNRHQVVSRSLIDYPGSSPQSYVQKGQGHIPAIPTIPQEQVDYLRSRLP